jgi:glycosyltransferase involved in cell wall biosynthesis
MRKAHDVLFHVPHVAFALHAGSQLPSGGAEAQVALIARELARRGRRVAVVVDDTNLPDSVDGIDLIPRHPLRLRIPGVSSLEALVRTFSAVIRARAPVVVQRCASVETGYVGLAARLTRRRFVYSSANVVDFDFGRIERSGLKVAAYRAGVRMADTIVAQTLEQVDLARDRFKRDARAIPSVAQPARGRRTAREAFLWIGRLAGYKHPEDYVDLAAAMPEARFRMIGVASGSDGRRLAAALAKRTASLPNLEVLDPRPRDELGPLYDSAVAVVNTAEFEGMPNVFLEGWARGVPALALRHDPDGVIAREGLGAFAAGDRKRLVEQARALWAAREDRDELRARCAAHVREHHSLERVADEWEDVLFGTGAADA